MIVLIKYFIKISLQIYVSALIVKWIEVFEGVQKADTYLKNAHRIQLCSPFKTGSGKTKINWD